MALAVFKDLVIDVSDADRMSDFWAAALGLGVHRYDTEDIVLRGPTPHHAVWINAVPEERTVKQRVHLDVHAESVAEYEAMGAAVLPEYAGLPWTVMGDPEGGELCVFVRDEVPSYRLYEVIVDCVDPVRLATWWGDVLGARTGEQDDFAYLDEIPGAPFESLVFTPVPEPKTVKNRIHWDVTVESADALEDLKGDGASVLRDRDPAIGWTVMADPEGNEFCVFTD
ncbi:VOC family protein [Solicola gregarius]|uniref:VOC family protein n=1 Tax=Solicola gregarius TaxID=2908642 RepID=A0AA46TIX8_9ACTN|nr:VOC family protein [Solicola gregarius]UYM06187.1 VOC family protein [Solicola gregarius]